MVKKSILQRTNNADNKYHGSHAGRQIMQVSKEMLIVVIYPKRNTVFIPERKRPWLTMLINH